MFGFPFADLAVREREVERGEHLFRRGDRVRFMHTVQWGEIQLVRHQANGAALVLQRAGRGAVVAEPSLFSQSYHCDAVASELTLVATVKASDLKAKLVDATFAEAWAAHLAGEMQAARLRAEILSLRTVAERLSAWLEFNELPDRHGQWKVVAAQIGVSHEALYRELARRRAGDV